MTTLPPEDQNGSTPGQQPESPQPPLQSPQQPEAPQAPQAPPQAPQQPEYQAPQQPQYQAPPQQGYAPPPGQQPPPQQGYPQSVSDPVSTITLNYWLSVFFAWIPALIFYLIEKDKPDRRAYEYHRDNLNFSLLRTIAGVATYILVLIPYIGWILAILLWIGMIVLFVFHIMAAVKAPEGYRTGQPPAFIFNIPLVK